MGATKGSVHPGLTFTHALFPYSCKFHPTLLFRATFNWIPIFKAQLPCANEVGEL